MIEAVWPQKRNVPNLSFQACERGSQSIVNGRMPRFHWSVLSPCMSISCPEMVLTMRMKANKVLLPFTILFKAQRTVFLLILHYRDSN